VKIRKANPDTQNPSKFTKFNPGNKAKTITPKPGKATNKADRERMQDAIKQDEKHRR
jgi:hypothetical protein